MKAKYLMSALSLIALVSCGGEGESSQASSSAASSAGGVTNITVWAGETEDSLAYVNEVAEAFKKAHPEKEYNFTVKAVSESSVSGDWAADPSQAADFAIAADDQIPAMIKSNLIQSLEPLDRYIEGLSDTIKTRNSKESIDMVTSEGKTYGFPVSASNGYILYYNSKYISKEDTTSFSSLLAAVKRASEQYGKNFRFGFPHHSGWYLDGWFRGAGFNVVGEAGSTTVECDWNKEVNGVKGVDVASSLVKLAHGEYKNQWTSQTQALLMTQIDDAQPNQIIATINGTWNYKRIKAAWGDNTAATVLPSYHVDEANKDFSMQSVKGFKIGIVNAKRAKTLIDSAKFAEFLTNYDNQILRFNALSEAPTNTEAASKVDTTTNPAVKALDEQWAKGSFTEKVNEAFWNPSNGLSDQLCAGSAGASASFITSGEGTADIVIDKAAVQAALDACVNALSGN